MQHLISPNAACAAKHTFAESFLKGRGGKTCIIDILQQFSCIK